MKKDFKKRLPANLFCWGTIEFYLSEDEFSWNPIVKKNKIEYEREFDDNSIKGGFDEDTLLDFPDEITQEMVDEFLKNGNFQISLCPNQDPHDSLYLNKRCKKYYIGGAFSYQEAEHLKDVADITFEIELTESEYNLATEILTRCLKKYGYIK